MSRVISCRHCGAVIERDEECWASLGYLGRRTYLCPGRDDRHEPCEPDLAYLLDPDNFDLTLTALERVVQESESLSLDSPEDRATLVSRLHAAVGVLT